MKVKVRGALLLTAASVVLATQADAATYLASRAVGANGFVDLSITTDGTLGNLATANIVDYTIKLTDTHGTLTLTRANSGYAITSGLSATATNLLFDFSGTGYALFQSPSVGSGRDVYCLAGQTCGFYSHAENLLVGTDYTATGISTTARSGVQIVATAGVPEPATWAMMVLGFGAVGGALRRRTTARVRFA